MTFGVSFSVFKLDYKNYLAFINHCSQVRGNSTCYGMLPTEEPVYNWRTVIVSTCTSRSSPGIRQIPSSHLRSTWCMPLGVCSLKPSLEAAEQRKLTDISGVNWTSWVVLGNAVKKETAVCHCFSPSIRV